MCRVALVALAAMLAVGSMARAQTLEQQREWCEDVSDPDHAVDGCTAVIQSGTGSLEVKAVAFNNRGYAYSRRANTTVRSPISIRPSGLIRR